MRIFESFKIILWLHFTIYLGQSIARPGVWKILLPDYQANDIEEGLVLFSICPNTFNTLAGFNQPFSTVKMRDFLQKASFERLQKQEKQQARLHLFSFHAIITLGCAHIFCPLGRMESPRIGYSYQEEDFFIPSRGMCMLKCSKVINAREKKLEKLVCNSSTF